MRSPTCRLSGGPDPSPSYGPNRLRPVLGYGSVFFPLRSKTNVGSVSGRLGTTVSLPSPPMGQPIAALTPSAMVSGPSLTSQSANPVGVAHPVPLGNRVRLVACRHSVPQAAWVYSLIRPLRTGLQRSAGCRDRSRCGGERQVCRRDYEDFCNSRRPHRALDQAAPLRPLPDGITDLDHFRVRRHDRAGGIIHEYRLVA